MNSMNQNDSHHLPRRQVGCVLLLAVVVRVAIVYWQAENLREDPDAYRQFAESLVDTGTYGLKTDHGVLPSAYRAPAYPLLLANLFVAGGKLAGNVDRIVWIGGIHILLGVATIAVVLWLGRQWGLRRGAIVAGFLVACDPILLHQSTLVMSETLATFLVVLVIAFLTRAMNSDSLFDMSLAGGSGALAALCRPGLFVFVAMSGVVFVVLFGYQRGRWWNVFIYWFTLLIVVAPWALRNWRLFGRPIITTTHGGYTLHLANNPSFYEYLRVAPWGTIWKGGASIEPPHAEAAEANHRLLALGPAGELARNEYHYAQAWATIRNQPAGMARATLVRVGRFWQWMPHKIHDSETTAIRWLRYTVGIWYVLVSVVAGMGLWRVGRKWILGPWIWGLLLCTALVAVHAIFWSNMRMRAPVVPIVALAAGAAVHQGRGSRRKSYIIKDIRLLEAR
ncbi:MAG: hypothetical protein JW829_04195 [Pirellulales bacterium]|nr:hypothetical protein [Pirellulales bacterium]